MFSRSSTRFGWGIGVACLAMLVMSVAGCGGDKDKTTKDVSIRTPSRSTATTPVATPPPVVAVTQPVAEPEPIVEPEPEPAREVTFEEAEAAYHDKRYGAAVDLFARYTERKSENPWGHYMLGLSAWKAAEYERAEAAFGRALELDPRHVKSRINLSRVLLDTSRPTEALAQLDEALSLDAESGTAYRLRGRAFHQLGRTEEALAAYRQAIQTDNEDAWSMNNLGLVLIEEGRFDEALPGLARAVELRDDVAVFRNNLGMALEWTGHFRAAEEAYRAAVALDESYENALANRERVAVVQQEPDLGPVDLAAMAQSFVDEIESWSVAVAETVAENAKLTESDIDPVVIHEADSTGGDSVE